MFSLHFKAERRPPPRSETFRDKTRESLEEGESVLFVFVLFFYSLTCNVLGGERSRPPLYYLNVFKRIKVFTATF